MYRKILKKMPKTLHTKFVMCYRILERLQICFKKHRILDFFLPSKITFSIHAPKNTEKKYMKLKF